VKGKFKLELSNFQWVKSRTGTGLRLTFSWMFIDADSEAVVGVSTDGCLVCRDMTGKLKFMLPVSRWGAVGARKLSHPTPDLCRTVVNIIENSKYAAKIGRDIPVDLMAQNVRETDPDLPTSIQGEAAIKEKENEYELDSAYDG
jgi:hypothetical protein